ncbi:MAG: hypothetical protein Q9205_008012, partial [Flavoplaca limonia]
RWRDLPNYFLISSDLNVAPGSYFLRNLDLGAVISLWITLPKRFEPSGLAVRQWAALSLNLFYYRPKTSPRRKRGIWTTLHRWRDPLSLLPVFATPWILTVEAKTGEERLNKADGQNVHSAGIALNAILELQNAAFEATAPEQVKDIFRKPLVFSVLTTASRQIFPSNVIGAYKIQRSKIDVISFFKRNGVDRFRPYNFTLSVYQTVGQEHRKLIKDALAALPTPSATGLSFATSEITLKTPSQQEST